MSGVMQDLHVHPADRWTHEFIFAGATGRVAYGVSIGKVVGRYISRLLMQVSGTGKNIAEPAL